MTTMKDLIEGAVDELKDRLKEEEIGEDEIWACIHDIADTRVPIYTRTLLEVACSEIWLAFSIPEC